MITAFRYLNGVIVRNIFREQHVSYEYVDKCKYGKKGINIRYALLKRKYNRKIDYLIEFLERKNTEMGGADRRELGSRWYTHYEISGNQ